jgi:hypothetical protein
MDVLAPVLAEFFTRETDAVAAPPSGASASVQR